MSQLHTRDACAQESCIPCFENEVQVEARFECPICLQCLKEPVLTSCGHRFCSTCIKSWLGSKGNSCPIDGQPINQEVDLFPDNFTRREIQELEEHVSHSTFQREKQSKCPEHQVVECSFRDVGCGETLPQDQLAAHLQTEILSHVNLLKDAFNNKVKPTEQEQKLEAKAQEANLWVPNPKGQCNHNEESAPHMQGLVRSLYERIVLLEQRNREQEIQMENLKRQLTSVSETVSTSIERLSQELTLRYSCGVYVWKITHFPVKLQAMCEDPIHSMLYSPGFYTSANGYRFCARLNLSPKQRDHLSLIIHLKKGENDAYLDWPFTGRISVMLVNNTYPHRHLKETMMSRPELDAFKQPQHDVNPRGFGYAEFISLLDLQSQGFISKDCIEIKIRVQSV